MGSHRVGTNTGLTYVIRRVGGIGIPAIDTKVGSTIGGVLTDKATIRASTIIRMTAMITLGGISAGKVGGGASEESLLPSSTPATPTTGAGTMALIVLAGGGTDSGGRGQLDIEYQEDGATSDEGGEVGDDPAGSDGTHLTDDGILAQGDVD